MPFALRYIKIMVERAVCCALVVVVALSCGFGFFNSGSVGIWNESTLTYSRQTAELVADGTPWVTGKRWA